MNDRELLELAARAAGYKLIWSYDNHCCWINEMRHDLDVTWNPLTDDGDALRLAVLLNLEIHSPQSDPTVMFRTAEHDVFYQDTCIRLAILRAAAEIGKSMGGGE
ncbi:TPA: hypothetical protein ACRNVW_001856 [Pseudomonas aeruginosa]